MSSFCERCVNLLRRLWAVSEELTGVGISGRLMRQTGADVTRRATLGRARCGGVTAVVAGRAQQCLLLVELAVVENFRRW
jgi:hypothetical protein